MNDSRYFTKEIVGRGFRNSANRIDVLMLAYSDILKFMDMSVADMIEENQDTRGFHALTIELHTLRDFLMAEVETLETKADKYNPQP